MLEFLKNVGFLDYLEEAKIGEVGEEDHGM